VRSYRDLPRILYHFQTKERDEPRPRAAVLRTREFVMKDAYTFDRDLEGSTASYAKHVTAYDNVFDRCGLEWYRVESTSARWAASARTSTWRPAPRARTTSRLRRATPPTWRSRPPSPQPVELGPQRPEPEAVHTPGQTTVAQVAAGLGVAPGALLKAFPVIVEDRGLVVVVVRGDHQVNEIKLANALRAPFRPAREEEFGGPLGPAGYIGPVGAQAPVLLDDAVAEAGGYACGANRAEHHLIGVQPGRDFPFERGDVRTVLPGDTVGGHALRIEPAIEVGNIFKLGTRYSEPLKATYLDEQGKPQHVWMGSYGIGPARIAAAAVEQTADERGIAWPRSLAPFDIELVGLGKAGTEERALADDLYAQLGAAGAEVLYDDRDGAGPGEKFADAELIGCPLRLTVGRRTLSAGELEVQVRRGMQSRSLPLDGAAEAAVALWRGLP
jgi:prolyl-tRNA synthetase